jgi:D-serine deaminase-like pyridoxal phosphate-dependent protein
MSKDPSAGIIAVNSTLSLNPEVLMDVYPNIEKPTLLLDCAVARTNLRNMVRKASDHRIRFRPHFKTHQSAEIGEWFRAEGVKAITVSSLEMAEYFAQSGWTDITIAFTANLRQMRAYRELAHKVQLGLLVESVETVEALAGQLDVPVDIWIKVDVGNHRTGLAWDHPSDIVPVVEAVRRAPFLHLRGLLTHAGQTYAASSPALVCMTYVTSVDRILTTRRKLAESLGLDLEVSVGDTPGCTLCASLGEVDEIRPGNFIFYDAQQLAIGSCQPEDIAVALACPVVAKHSERSEVVLYGGAIHLSKDYLMVGDQRSFGLPAYLDRKRWSAPIPGGLVRSLSQEHGIVSLPKSDFERIHVGNLLAIIPAHSCLTVTAMGNYLTLDGKTIATLNKPVGSPAD